MRFLPIFLLFCAFVIFQNSTYAQTTITGAVFRDFNTDGKWNTSASYNIPGFSEPGMAGITVTAFFGTGSNVTTTSGLNGAYTLTGVTLPARLEFSNLPPGCFESTIHRGSRTNLNIIRSGDQTSDVNFGVNFPDDFVDSPSNIKLAIPLSSNGNGLGGGNTGNLSSIVSFNYKESADIIADVPYTLPDETITLIPRKYNDAQKTAALNRNTGNVWGVAYDRDRDRLYSAAFLKRYTGLGPHGLGGLYISDGVKNAASPTYSSYDLASAGIAFGTVTSNISRGLQNNYDQPVGTPFDAAAYGDIGKVGMGDIDLTPDGKYLFMVNLNNKNLYKLDVSGASPTVAGQWPIPNPGCQNGNWRPFGLKIHHGSVYVGGVCDASSGQNFNDLKATVYKFDGTSFTQVFDVPLNYVKGYTDPNSGSSPGCDQHRWSAWSDIVPASCLTFLGIDWAFSFQPILSNMEFDDDGSMILYFSDRHAHQEGWNNYSPDGTKFRSTMAGGDLLRVCYVNGNYVLPGSSGCNNNRPNSQGPNGGEWYFNEGGQDNSSLHQEQATGSGVYIHGYNEVITTLFGPIQDLTGGVHYYDSESGTLNESYEIYRTLIESREGFGKAHGLGDVEILSGPPPVQIGNRVWADTNGDGVQDPDEYGIANVVIELWDGSNLLARNTTSSNGTYFWSSGPPTSFEPGEENETHRTFNIAGLKPNKQYRIVIPQPENATIQPALQNFVLTGANLNPGNLGTPDVRDSDGIYFGGFPIPVTIEANVLTSDIPMSGVANLNFDFGFKPCALKVNLGNDIEVCSNLSLILTTSVTNAIGTVTYLWDNNSTGSSRQIFPSGSPSYTVTVSDQSGCTATDAVLVTVNSIPTANAGTDFIITCTQNPTGKAIGTTAVSGMTYLWSPAAGLSSTTVSNPTANPTATTTYTVTVTNTASGCTATDAVLVTVNKAAATANAGTDFIITCTQNPAGKAIGTTAVSGMTYLWSPAAGLSSTTVSNPTANPTATTTYTVTVTNTASGCTATDAVLVTVNKTVPIANAASKSGDLTCAVTSVTLSVKNSVTNLNICGTADESKYNYLWSNNATTCSITVSSAGSYSVTVTDKSNQCNTSSQILVNISAPITGGLTNDGPLTCSKSSVRLTATPCNLSQYNYQWSGPAGWTNPGNTCANVTTAIQGTYNVTITDKTSLCSATASTDVITSTAGTPQPSCGGPYSKCSGSTTPIQLCGTIDYPEDYDFQWYMVSGSFEIPITTNGNQLCGPNVNPSATTNYKLVATSKANPQCSGFCTTTINVNPNPDGGPNIIMCGTETTLDLPNGIGGALPTQTTLWDALPVSAPAGSTARVTERELGTVTGLTVVGKYEFKLVHLASGCFDIVEVTKYANPDGGPNITICGTETTLDLPNGIGGALPTQTTLWDALPVSAPAGSTARVTERELGTVTGLTVVGKYEFKLVHLTSGCFDIVEVTKYANPDGGPNIIMCGTETTLDLPNGIGGALPTQTTLWDALPVSAPAGSNARVTERELGTVTGLTVPGKYEFKLVRLYTGCYDIVEVTVNPTYKIGNYVWEDTDVDGIQDATELGFNGVTVTLYNSTTNQQVASTTTATNAGKAGWYEFNVCAGGYYIIFGELGTYPRTKKDAVGSNDQNDSDADRTTGRSQDFTITNADNFTIDAGYYRLAHLGNYVWEDQNLNGIQDAGDVGINGVTVILTGMDAFGNNVSLTTTTSTNGITGQLGNYLFSNLVPGTYTVTFIRPGAEYKSSLSNVGSDDARDSDADITTGVVSNIILSSGESNMTIDAGYYRCSNVGDYVWLDDDRNGKQDDAENGLNGFRVELYKSDNTFVDFTITKNDPRSGKEGKKGYYNFEICQPGGYYIKVINPTNSTYSFVTPLQGGDVGKDSNVDKITGQTAIFGVGYNVSIPDIDAGLMSAPLPVTLKEFGGRWNQTRDVNELTWVTATEINNAYFEVGRSFKGSAFEAVGKVEGAGNSNSEKRYHLDDRSISTNGVYTYRLRQVDFDGKETYSAPIDVLVQRKGVVKTSIWPNPTGGQVTIEILAAEGSKVTADIYDNTGRMIRSSIINGVSEGKELFVNIDGGILNKGVYFIMVNIDGEVSSHKLIVIE
jgi:hypothetical protein